MHYYGFDEHLKLQDFEEFAEYIAYLYTLNIRLLVSIRRRLYRDKSVRRFVGSSPLFDKDSIVESIISATNNLAMNKRNNFL